MEAIGMHRSDYGEYVIAFEKTSKLAKKLTPLIYVNEDGPLAEMVREKYGRHLSKFDEFEGKSSREIHYPPKLLDREKLAGLWDFLPYMKSTVGHTLQRQGYQAVWMTKALEEEFEWRYVPENHRNKIYCFADYDEWNLRKLDKFSEATKDSFLAFSPDEVKAVIVPRETEQDELVGIHPRFKGIVTTWKRISDTTIRYR
jgi:hypothetical protein